MSYATSLLMAYPPPYGPSTLLSDDLVQRSSHRAYYEPSLPYSTTNRLYSDSLTYNPISYGSTNYESSLYSQYPSTNYRATSITDWRRNIPQDNTYGTINDIREYSESLGTTSNTTTASSFAHSIKDNRQHSSTNKLFPNYQQSYNRLLNDTNRSPHRTTIWSSNRPKISSSDEKSTPSHRSRPESSAPIEQKKSPIVEVKTDRTPVPSPSPPAVPPAPPFILTKQESNLEKQPTLVENENQEPSVDIQAWLSETKDEIPSQDDKTAEQAWTVKIDQLHAMKAQREKEKVKASRALPNITKKPDNQSLKVNDNRIRQASFQMRNNSYFDSLFDGNFYRKTSNNQRSVPTQNQSKPIKTTIVPKYVPKRKAPQHEPSSVHQPVPPVTTTSWKNQHPKQNSSESLTPRDNIFKDEDERYRDALNKFRSDRAEQHKSESNESTAKRLNYGDYVRRSTKNALLRNVIKPLPWSDFIDLKKGNLYSLTKEEKKDRYNQLRSYGERIRNRNFALLHVPETARSQRRSIFLPTSNQEPESDNDQDEISHEQTNTNDNDNNDESKSSKRTDSEPTIKATNKTFTKRNGNGDVLSNRSGRTTIFTDQSSALRPSEEEDDEDVSDFELSRKQKKKLRFTRYDSSARTTTATEESETDETNEQRSIRTKTRDTDDDLFTVREEKTQESLEGARYKKR